MALEFLQDVIFGSDNFTITSGSSGKPEVFITTTGNNNKPCILTFTKDKGAAGADADGIGAISFVSDNDAQQQTTFGNILYSVESATDGQEEGKIDIGVAALNSGGNNSANVIQGVGNGQNVTDVTIGLGATNVTTIAGTLTMGSTATLDNSGNLLTNAATATALTSGNKTISGDLTTNNVFLPGDGVISFDDSLDGSDQFITGTDSALTIVGDNRNNLRATTETRFQTLAASTYASIKPGGIYTAGDLDLGHETDTTISRSAAGTVEIEGNQVVTANVGTGNLMHIVLKDMQSYMFYLYNDDSWYSNGTTTLAILGSSTDPSAISSGNSEYQGRVPSYIAPQACIVKKLCFSFYWSSSATNSADIDFGFSKFTPIADGTAASIPMNKIDATDHNGSYTEVKPYYKTFTFSGANATLAAGDAFAMHMRTTGGSNAQRVLVYATATLEIELT